MGLVLLSTTPAFAQPTLDDSARGPLKDTPVGFLGPTGAIQLSPLRQALVDVSARAQVAGPWFRAERHTANNWGAPTHLVLGGGLRDSAHHTVDAHLEQLLLDMGMPLGRFAAVGVRLGGGRLWGGGDVDGAIEAFHRQGKFFNFSRERAPAARTLLRIQGTDSPTVLWEGPRSFVPSTQVMGFVRLLENRTTQLLWRTVLQLPTGDMVQALQLFAPEVATGMSLFQRVGPFAALYLAGHVLWHGNTRLGGLWVEPQMLGEISLEVRIFPNVTLLAEDRLQSPLMATVNTHMVQSRFHWRSTLVNAYFTPVNIITGGARLYLPHQSAVTLHIGEDFMLCMACYRDRFSRENNAPDISLSLTLEQVLPRRAP